MAAQRQLSSAVNISNDLILHDSDEQSTAMTHPVVRVVALKYALVSFSVSVVCACCIQQPALKLSKFVQEGIHW
jgi:hypothetical protein